MATLEFDVLIVGSGLAGLSAALHLAPTRRVAVITKRELQEGSSRWAQGGIAAVLANDDSFAAHIQDTQVAGAGLCDLATTRFVVENAPAAIGWLRGLGVPFTLEGEELHLTREGGHSARRIVHATDATGAAVQKTLIDVVRETPGIRVFEHHTLVDLITSRKLGLAGQRCLGLYALDEARDEVVTFRAPQTILATGGAGKVYLYTTNPDTATGDGI
ncbi:MAG TPA: FAD-dependent oxidoreductase, partial [Ottowia sp.]|nr:FAD-dependent oxidoreductase [Ottowia sp.]